MCLVVPPIVRTARGARRVILLSACLNTPEDGTETMVGESGNCHYAGLMSIGMSAMGDVEVVGSSAAALVDAAAFPRFGSQLPNSGPVSE